MPLHDRQLNARGKPRTQGVPAGFPSSSFSDPKIARAIATKISDVEVAALLKMLETSTWSNSLLGELLGVTPEAVRLIRTLQRRENVAVALWGEDVQPFVFEVVVQRAYAKNSEDRLRQQKKDLLRAYEYSLGVMIEKLGLGWTAPPLPEGWSYISPRKETDTLRQKAEAKAQAELQAIEEKLTQQEDLDEQARTEELRAAERQLQKSIDIETGEKDQFSMTRSDWLMLKQTNPTQYWKTYNRKLEIKAQGLWHSVDWDSPTAGMRGGYSSTSDTGYSSKPQGRQISPEEQARIQASNQRFTQRQKQNRNRGRGSGWGR